MGTFQTTAKSLNTQIASPAFAEFVVTSITYADVPDATGYTAGIDNYYGGTCVVKNLNSIRVTSAQMIDLSLTEIHGMGSNQGQTFTRINSTTLKVNDTGALLTFKVQIKTNVVNEDATIQANSAIIGAALYTNISDLLIKASVKKIRIWTCGSVSEGLFGISSSNTEVSFSEIDVNSLLLNGFIFTANSGLTLMDWSGTLLEIIA